MSDVKLFNKWDYDGIKVTDVSLEGHLNINPLAVPHTCARHTRKQFWKSKVNVVERFISKLMVVGHVSASRKHIFTSGRNTGKKVMLCNAVESAFSRVEQKTKKNPIQVFVDAVQHSAPMAEITSVEMGGVRRPIAVDVAPQRRLDLALALLSKGIMQSTKKSHRPLDECITEEIILAAAGDMKSFAVGKKENLERQAEASR